MDLHNRAYGCLLGQVIGDSMGTLSEFQDQSTATHLVKQYLHENGGWKLNGRLNDQPKIHTITDDSEMALALARSLVRNKGYHVKDVVQSYVTWSKSNPIDMGTATQKTFMNCSLHYDPERNYREAISSSLKYNGATLSNGCLMRTAPLGLAGVKWSSEQLYQAGKLDCTITNPHPVAQKATCLYLNAIKTAILTGDLSTVVENAVGLTKENGILRRTLMDSIRTAEYGPIPMLHGGHLVSVRSDSKYQGYLGIALYDTFYELTHTTDFSSVLRHILSRGGDTDTNGAIACALFGAVHGYQSLPSNLVKEILTQTYVRSKIYPWGQTHDLKELSYQLVNLT